MAKKNPSISREIVGIKLPARMKIDSLKTSIRRAFINTIVPEVRPTAAQEAAWRAQLGIAPLAVDGLGCVYCGRPATQLDHFRNLTAADGRPSGYITDIYNLVPCCSTCNSSKAGKHWKIWMTSNAANAPNKRLSATELADRVAVLDRFEVWSTPLATRLDVLALIGVSEWEQYEADVAAVVVLLQAARQRSDRFHLLLQQAYAEALVPAAQPIPTAVSPTGLH
ncbi:HNH endonuclease (plasmid) [Hymenobacter sp. 5317J-9]|uniref:HNH endonuclease n=1 Tax=Hymenobacter sp. 5317J-9 TaxID=2932250 RepID=UPI001FD681B0|nr:HNH endonuclease [Hymenobacter sp. 5317J-9]UOR00146.1 HNH endonuclease [Hymenobacter sp. 5317J-9]